MIFSPTTNEKSKTRTNTFPVIAQYVTWFTQLPVVAWSGCGADLVISKYITHIPP